MAEPLNALIAGLDALLADLEESVAAHAEEIGGVAPVHRKGAVNLVEYTTLRHQDVRNLQNDLMDLGATSLATVEANVGAKVHAARNVLSALRGDPGPWQLAAIDDALHEGDEILNANAQALFGPQRPGRPTRIMVTMPTEAADDAALITAFVAAGMDVARINCAHDGPTHWARMIENIRSAASAAGRRVLISMDVAGPKLRTGPICSGPGVGRARVTRDDTGRLVSPSTLRIVPADRTMSAAAPVVTGVRGPLTIEVDPAWWSRRRVGDVLWMRDNRGLRRVFTVSAVSADDMVAQGQRSAYVANGAVLVSSADGTDVGGIMPLPRRLSLAPGDRLVLTSDLTPVRPPGLGEIARIGCTLPEAVAALRPGQSVLFDDGAIGAVVESNSGEQATLTILRTKPGGQRLGAEKGINLPETELPLPALTAEDESHLPFISAHADLVAVSFVRSVADIEQIIKALDAVQGDHLGLVLKIETAQGFRELPSMLLAAMRRPRLGVMIARGDLAVEVGFERLSEIPRQILALCEAAHVPAIWATQVLDTLAQTGQASRAEITDAAAAQRADCVMLNKGPHILEAIRTLDDILVRMDEVQRKSRTLMRHIHSWDGQ